MRETAAAHYKFESAALKFEFIKLQTLPPPLNLVQLLISALSGFLSHLQRVLCYFCMEDKAEGPARLTRPVMSEAWRIVLKSVKKQLDSEKKAEDEGDEGDALAMAVTRAIKPDLDKALRGIAKLEAEVSKLRKAAGDDDGDKDDEQDDDEDGAAET